MNDRLQRWHKERKKFDLEDYLQTEEGLAAINQLLPLIFTNESGMTHSEEYHTPLLKRAAMLYYGCYLASRMSFADLFVSLFRYQPEPHQRWKECVRMKRGLAHTCKPGGMYKDQIYLMGAVNILKKRQIIDFRVLHSGKISVGDCNKIVDKKIYVIDGLKMPRFIDDMARYKRALNLIAMVNEIE